MRHKQVQQCILGGRELHRHSVKVAQLVVHVDAKLTEDDVGDISSLRYVVGALAAHYGTAQHAADTCHKLVFAIRLHDVVVGTDIKPHHTRLLIAYAGTEDDGHIFGGGIVLEAFCKVKATHLGHSHLKNEK